MLLPLVEWIRDSSNAAGNVTGSRVSSDLSVLAVAQERAKKTTAARRPNLGMAKKPAIILPHFSEAKKKFWAETVGTKKDLN
ncbi:MAG TPA: hypothetical protein VI585_06940 [Candidatus Binatia bacterium]